jgi:chromosome segregation ATPase
MANNIAVSITADVADLQVKRAIMSAELRTATKDLNSYAAEAQKSGQTDELRTSMLTAADAVARYKNQIADNERRQKELRSEFTAQAAAMRAQATAMETENQAAQKLSVNYQAIINASTGVDIATRSAAESASVFEQVLGVQSQRAQEVRARLQQLEEQQQGSVAMTGQQSTSAQKLSVNYQAIINASTGVNAATRSAAESASVFEQALGCSRSALRTCALACSNSKSSSKVLWP